MGSLGAATLPASWSWCSVLSTKLICDRLSISAIIQYLSPIAPSGYYVFNQISLLRCISVIRKNKNYYQFTNCYGINRPKLLYSKRLITVDIILTIVSNKSAPIDRSHRKSIAVSSDDTLHFLDIRYSYNSMVFPISCTVGRDMDIEDIRNCPIFFHILGISFPI